MGDLLKWAQDNSPYLKIADNGEVLVKYKKFEVIDDSRNPGKKKIRYTVEYNGNDKYFESAATKVAMSMDSFKIGEMIIIKREMVSGKARYSVAPGEPAVEQILEEESKEIKSKKRG